MNKSSSDIHNISTFYVVVNILIKTHQLNDEFTEIQILYAFKICVDKTFL